MRVNQHWQGTAGSVVNVTPGLIVFVLTHQEGVGVIYPAKIRKINVSGESGSTVNVIETIDIDVSSGYGNHLQCRGFAYLGNNQFALHMRGFLNGKDNIILILTFDGSSFTVSKLLHFHHHTVLFADSRI